MRKIALWLVIAVLVTSCVMSHHSVRETAVRLDLVGLGVCSGTVVGPHAILTATHCFEEPAKLQVDGSPVVIVSRVDDGNDHSILYVNKTFGYWAHIGKTPAQGASVYMWGNADGMFLWYRRGYVVGTMDEDGNTLTAYDLNGFFGDSGSALFGEDGSIVGVVSKLFYDEHEGVAFRMMASYPFNFTPQELAAVGT